MSVCSFCGFHIRGNSELCPYHHDDNFLALDWATGNRLMCNFFHRGISSKAVCTCDAAYLKIKIGHREDCPKGGKSWEIKQQRVSRVVDRR